MAATDYLSLRCLIDGVYQVEVSNIQMEGQSGAQVVQTLEGFAGKTPGPKQREITITWAVPKGGLEFDADTACANGTFHEIMIPVGAKTIVASGFWDTSSLGQSTGASTEFSSKFMADFEPAQ